MAFYSHSKISTFEQCPKKYEFGYVLKAPKGPDSIEAFMGSRVHDALEWLYGEVRACRLPTADDVLAKYAERWDAEFTDSITVVRKDGTAEDYRAVGEKALRDYHARYTPFDSDTSVGLELKIDVPLGDAAGGRRLRGFIDRLTKVSDGVWEIHDYKTSNKLMTQAEAEADRQLALYAWAVRQMYPDAREVSLVWHYLAFDQEVRSSRTPDQLAALVEDTLAAIDAIEAACEYPTKTSTLCDWCEYRSACPAWRRADELSAMPPDEFAAQDDVALVDRYMELTSRASEIDAEKAAVRDAIVARADRDGLDQLLGTSTVMRVWRYTGAVLPGRDDPRRAQVEAIIAEDGLAEAFRRTDWFALSKQIAEGRLPQPTLERLEPYVTIERGAKLYPRMRT